MHTRLAARAVHAECSEAGRGTERQAGRGRGGMAVQGAGAPGRAVHSPQGVGGSQGFGWQAAKALQPLTHPSLSRRWWPPRAPPRVPPAASTRHAPPAACTWGRRRRGARAVVPHQRQRRGSGRVVLSKDHAMAAAYKEPFGLLHRPPAAPSPPPPAPPTHLKSAPSPLLLCLPAALVAGLCSTSPRNRQPAPLSTPHACRGLLTPGCNVAQQRAKGFWQGEQQVDWGG